MEPQTVPPPSSPTQISDKEDFYVVVEEMPQLIGGLEEIKKSIRYPAEARKKGIEGRVYVQFVVTEDGNVEDAKVIRGIGAGADEEALRVVRQAKFEPGYQRGEPVRVQYSLPIFFQLIGDGQETSTGSKAENQEDGLTVTGYASTEIQRPEVDYKSMEVNVSESGDVIEGTVIDAETGSPLIGANIILQGSNKGTNTDQNGHFTLSKEDIENSSFLVSYIGYKTARYRL
jgi:TonB family protein